MKKNNIPMRKCIGCALSKPQSEMTRIAWYQGSLTVDTVGKAKGRGVYLCGKPCLENAIKRRGFNRSFKCEMPDAEIEKIKEELDNE